MAAQVLLRRAPDRIQSLVLSNTAAPNPRRARRARRHLAVLAFLPDSLVRRMLHMEKVRVMNLARLSADFYGIDFGPHDLASWPGKVLVLSADGDELYGSMHARLRRLYPGADAVTFPGGHTASTAHLTE
jgi:pimeloyl-ACP methyl ester carboxylesterase